MTAPSISLILIVVTLFGPCSNDEYSQSYNEEQFRRNFGCENEGHYMEHNLIGPNCPCGYFARDIKKSDLRHISMGNRQTPYWRKSADDSVTLQYYRCERCSMCGDKSPVLKQCTIYTDTECGTGCEEPYVETNAGCYLPDNVTFEEAEEWPSTTSVSEPAATAGARPLHGATVEEPGSSWHQDLARCVDSSMHLHIVGVLIGFFIGVSASFICCVVRNRCCRKEVARPRPV